MIQKPDDLPVVDLWAKRTSIEWDEGATCEDVLGKLSHALADAGIAEQWCASELTGKLKPTDPWPSGRIICYPMRGGSEAYWVDLLYWKRNIAPPLPNADGTIFVIGCIKAWSWQEAVELAALTAQILDISD